MAFDIKGTVTSSMQKGNGQDFPSDESSTSHEEWYSGLADVVDFISGIANFIGIIDEVVGPVVFVGGLFALWKKRRKRGDRIGRKRPDAPRGPRLRRKRQPLTKPPASVNRAAGDLMAEAMKNGLGVPLVYSPKKKRRAGTNSDRDSDSSKTDPPRGRRIANAYRQLKLYWLIHDTSPKPEFEVSDWQFVPAADFANDEGYRFSEALTLSFGLAPGELAEHFKRSVLTADKYKEKTMVVATPHDVHDEDAWVRTIIVESGRVGIDDQRRKRVVLYSSPKAVAAGSHVGRIKRREVPDDAIWIVCNTKHAAPPGPRWWEDPDECRSKHSVAAVVNDEQREHVQTLINGDLRMKAGLWVILGPVASGWTFAAGFFDSDQDNKVPFIAAGVSWFIFFLLVSFAVLCYRLWVANRARRWLDKDGMTKDQWSGSTVRGLAVGKLANMVSVVSKESPTSLGSFITRTRTSGTIAAGCLPAAAASHERSGRFRRMLEKVKGGARLKRTRRKAVD